MFTSPNKRPRAQYCFYFFILGPLESPRRARTLRLQNLHFLSLGSSKLHLKPQILPTPFIHQMESPPSSSAPGLEDCLKLLKGERDEQRLAGLLLATKFCQSNDTESVLKVYNAVGTRFLDRLLMTGMGKGMVGNKGGEDREAYLHLSVTVLSTFCRVPEIAASKDMVKKVPAVLEIIST